MAPQPYSGNARQVRGAMIEVLSRDYIQTARAKGLSTLSIIVKHGLKNATVRRGAEPGVPIQVRRDRFGLRLHVRALRPVGAGAVSPGVDLGDVADFAAPDDFGALAGAGIGVALVAHLRGDAVFGGPGGELLGLPDGAGQRLLTVDVLAAGHGPHGGGGVHVVGAGDEDGVDVLVLIQHDAEILVFRRVGKLFEGAFGAFVIGIAEGDDVLAGAAVQVREALAAGTDGGDVELLRRRLVAKGLERGGGIDRTGGERAVEEMATGNGHGILGLHGYLISRRSASPCGTWA